MAKKTKKPAEDFVGYRYWSPNIPLSAIRRYARQIAEKFQPDKIILFGSYAYGQPHEWSDVDILCGDARVQPDQQGHPNHQYPRSPFLLGSDRAHPETAPA